MKLTIKQNGIIMNEFENCLSSFINFMFNKLNKNENYPTKLTIKENLDNFIITFSFSIPRHDGTENNFEYIYDMPRESGGFLNTYKMFGQYVFKMEQV